MINVGDPYGVMLGQGWRTLEHPQVMELQQVTRPLIFIKRVLGNNIIIHYSIKFFAWRKISLPNIIGKIVIITNFCPVLMLVIILLILMYTE